MKRGLVGGLVLGALALAGVTLGAAAYSDPAGDDNAAPDITSVSVVEAPDGSLDVRVVVANFATLPPSSWFNMWFDVDGDASTGDSVGDDVLVHFPASGAVALYVWDGQAMGQVDPAGIAGRFEAGTLTMTIPSGALGALSSPGILVVGARGQTIGTESLVASDFAPDSGRMSWTGGQPTVSDPEGDHDAAPDITAIRVSDSKDGWITFAISTPNRETLPGKSLVAVSIDRDANLATGDNGAEVEILDVGGEVLLQRWNTEARRWVDDQPPTRVRARNAAGVVTIDVHRSELDNVSRFGFRLVSADLNATTGDLVAVDFAPDSGAFWRYTLENAPALRLIAGKATGTPSRPRAGKPFTISTPVRRSDTNRAITSGRVTCNVRSGSTRVRAAGRIRGGRGHCALVVPARARMISGFMTIRSSGKTVMARFSFRVG